ncbi:lysosomal acid glucosylceramidase [Octopus sinensis]|uniref:Glucosylceramidase n=1 Tax=Octopus sinensis TaxID=2607531 RepID=A0A6P7T8V2_9MOLL|nr:lysosomal acid glucosylceramidase [Octopus sinensis]XP_036365870.1 lysosomal acid glucosylceramidase [Octopus sinensis]
MKVEIMGELRRVPVTLFIFLGVLFWKSYGELKLCYPRNYNFGSFVCVCNSTYCDTVPNIEKLDIGRYVVIVTDKRNFRLSNCTGSFKKSKIEDASPMSINYNKTFQKIIGFGGAFTDATGINVVSLPKKAQEKLLQSYFSPLGIEYNIGRVPIASCDFSTRIYSYDDAVNDTKLMQFDLAEEDLNYKIPLIKKAQKMSKRKVLLFGSPWSAPAWMKTNNNMTGMGMLKGKPGGAYYNAWALYFVKFLEEYKHFNITFWGLTAQNEPVDGLIYKFPFQAMGWTPQLQRDFIIKDLGPLLHSYGYGNLKLMIFDDQRTFLVNWVKTVLNNTLARTFVSGIGVHWYEDIDLTLSFLDKTHELFPNHFILGTEACAASYPWEQPKVALGSWKRAESYSKDIIQDLNHWVTGWTDWNMALDLEGGPNWAKNFVDSAIIVNKTAGEFYKQPMYYIMAHFSKYILPDSVRIEITNIPKFLDVVGFLRPDKATVVVIVNRQDQSVKYTIRDPHLGQIVGNADQHSIQTLIWWNK